MSAKRVRVVYLVSTLRRAGPTLQLRNIVRYLDRRKFDPLVVTLSPEPANSMIGSFTELGVAVKSFSMSRPRAALHRRWRRDIEQLAGTRLVGECVLHSQGIRGDVISSRQLSGVRRVATARNYPYHDYVMKCGPLLGRWMARTHLRALGNLPVVVACSSTLSELLHKHRIDATVIRNGVDTLKFSAALPEERAILREELGLPLEARIGVCVGALIELKDSLRIVHAMRAVANSELAMVFVGSGNLESSCRREAQGDTRIRFVGQVDDVERYLRAADFLVSASRSEGLPNAVLEAIACGLYVILSDIDAHRELLRPAPSAGELFATGDQAALVAAIGRAASRWAGSNGLAPETIAEEYGAERMSQRYQELYLRLTRESAFA